MGRRARAISAVATTLNANTDSSGQVQPTDAKPGNPNTHIATSVTVNVAAFTSQSTHHGATTSRAHMDTYFRRDRSALAGPGDVVGGAGQHIQRHPAVGHVVLAEEGQAATLTELACQDVAVVGIEH